MNNLVYYPKEERWTGRPRERISGTYPLFKEHFGAQFGFHNGWELAHWFAADTRSSTSGDFKKVLSDFKGVASDFKEVSTLRDKNAQGTSGQVPLVTHGGAHYKPSFRRTNWFEPVRREVETVLHGVGIIDLTPFAKIHVHGNRAAEFLDILCANSLPRV